MHGVGGASKEVLKMGFGRLLALSLSILGFALPANAGVQMYTGELIVHMRGSDAAGNFIAVPLGAHCNTRAYHAHETATLRGFSVVIPKFGGQIPVIDTNTDSVPDVATGCAPASLQAGLPLTGGGAAATTGTTTTSRTAKNPRAFTLPKSNLSRMTSGASFLETTWLPLPLGTPLLHWEIEYADLKNDAGGFSNGGGPGSFTVSHTAKVRVTAGPNRFGGTMRLLGEYYTNRGLATISKSSGATPWNLQYIGAGAETAMGKVTGGRQYSAMISRKWLNLASYGYSARTATISAFPWTTGMVEVTASGGPQATILKRTGYDNRTPGGEGTIQMVSPALTRWKHPFSDYYTGSIATLKLTFVPEPTALLMLVPGIGALAILKRVSDRRARE
jgi:hypothetical protein